MKIEFNINDAELIKFIENQKALDEKRFGEKKTNAQIVQELFTTGAFRRSAARRWAKKHLKEMEAAGKKAPRAAKPAKKAPAPKKVKTAKPKGPLARKVAAAVKAKPPRIRKAKVAAVTAVESAPVDAASPAPVVLD